MKVVALTLAVFTALGLTPSAFVYALEQPWVEQAIPAKTVKKTDSAESANSTKPFLSYIANLQGNVGKIGNALAVIGHCQTNYFADAEQELVAQINALSSSSALYKKTILGDVYGALNQSRKLLKEAQETEKTKACTLVTKSVNLWLAAREGNYGEQLVGTSLVDLTIGVIDSDGRFSLGDPTGPAFAPQKPKKKGPEPGVDREYF